MGTYNKLKINNFGPCKILRKHDSKNAHKVEFPSESNIQPVFKILDLIDYHEGSFEDEVTKE